MTPAERPDKTHVECDHEWLFQDDSFDHAFGTEVIRYWQCEKCGETKPYRASDDRLDDDC